MRLMRCYLFDLHLLSRSGISNAKLFGINLLKIKKKKKVKVKALMFKTCVIKLTVMHRGHT